MLWKLYKSMEYSKDYGWLLKEFQDVIHGVEAGMIPFRSLVGLMDLYDNSSIYVCLYLYDSMW
jgi:hypothetical protein